MCAAGIVAAQPRIPPPQLAPAGDTGRRITDEGLLANYFPAARKAPAVLLIGGSVGGLSLEMNNAAKALQSEGFSALHLSYFRAPGQNPRLELIPVEYFAAALTWLRRQPEVDPARIAILGGSKGAEAALVVAVRHPELKAVIAALPSSVVWPGIVWGGSETPIGSSWSESGRPVPHLSHAPYDADKGGTQADAYGASLESLPKYPEAIIPVERIEGRVLLVCGEADRLWPSCPMARQIEQRLREHGRPAATLLAYHDAGHAAFGLPMPLDDPRLTSLGGTPQGVAAARSDSWQKAVAFLKAILQN
jgi:dienelactone hydrolase